MKSRNLIPAYRLTARARGRRLRAWILGGSVYAALLIGVYLGSRATWGGNREALAAEREKIDVRMQQTSRTVRSLQHELDTVNLQLHATQAIEDQPDWSLLLAMLPARLTDDVFLRRCEIKPVVAEGAATAGRTDSAYVLRLAGYGRTMTSVLAFVQGLESIGLFDQVRLTRTNSEPLLAGTAISFQAECVMGGGSGATP
jgi:hypothetical protein